MASRPSREKRGYWLSASRADRSTRSSCRIICSRVTAGSPPPPPPVPLAASLSGTPTDDDVSTVRKDDDAASASASVPVPVPLPPPTSRRCIVDVESTPWQNLRMPRRRMVVV
ncbi:hypothetical protein E2562_001659 [Oryza meyeriana var. granulata]|uniref:Uncharacterized protein n=1 Tax=Oryza meyeriana var. granulata TaxID=110450 RepID=A0A6G1CCU4_9ORYZ|nr:hypothetical protein E2562_001659 [Oryza meyeriana var. granulata]